MRKQIDDYELMDKDWEEFIRRGREELEWEAKYQQRGDNENVSRRLP